MSQDKILATLTKLAEAHPKRADFNKAVKVAFPFVLGSGAFRRVHDTDEGFVIKLRHDKPKRDNAFPMREIDSSNKDELAGYNKIKRRSALLAHFVLKPTYFALPNGHDVVLMEKMDNTWDSIGYAARRNVEKNNHALHNQVQVIEKTFNDGHWKNIGIKGNRAFLLDVNFSNIWSWDDEDKAFARLTLEKAGVKLRGRKPKKVLMTMEAAA